MSDEQLRKGLEAAFRPLMKAINVQFEFHSATVTEDGAALLVLFEGTDGHTYACSIPQSETFGQQPTLRRVD